MYALIDCDHFFASCERVFRPDLWYRPVAVLSNNDGCVIARSPEVKSLGVKMGEPFFQCHSKLQAHQVAVFSSNFSLYADLSRRVMQTIREFIEEGGRPRVEVYSIDEAFVDVSELSIYDLSRFAHELRRRVLDRTGIPVSIGLGLTKSLAKAATHFAKRSPERIHLLHTEQRRVSALRQLDIEAVWGVGRRWAERLRRIGLERALDLAEASPERIRIAARHVYLLRLSRELRGERCIPLETSPPPRSSIRYSRTFSRPIKDEVILREAISAFAAQLGQRLRTHQRRAGSLLLWLSASSPARRSGRSAPLYYRVKLSAGLPSYTADSSSLIKLALTLYQSLSTSALSEAPSLLGRPIAWRKAGLLALDLRDDSQLELATMRPDPRRVKLSKVEDELNRRFGRGAVQIGGIPVKPLHRDSSGSIADQPWRALQSSLSPRYTTCWSDLPVVSAL